MTHMPRLALGTWPLSGAVCTDTVAEAVSMGYAHVDTAQMYGNEAEVGAGIAASGVARGKLFVTTKVHQDRFTDGTVMDSARRSADALGGPPDLLLAHWPPKGISPRAVVDALEAVRAAGLTKAIGVSNFNVSQMQSAAKYANILTNQVEFHAYLDQSRLLAAARSAGVTLSAYMSIARGKVLDDPVITEIAAVHDISPAAVALRWIIQQDVVAICMSTKTANLAGNLKAMEVTLSDAEMTRISALTRRNARYCDPFDWAPDWSA